MQNKKTSAKEMQKMQAEAIKRVKELHARSKIPENEKNILKENISKSELKFENDKSDKKDENTEKNNSQQSNKRSKETTFKNQNIIDLLFNDKDKTLIILLIIMLMDEKDNFLIIIILLYLLI